MGTMIEYSKHVMNNSIAIQFITPNRLFAFLFLFFLLLDSAALTGERKKAEKDMRNAYILSNMMNDD